MTLPANPLSRLSARLVEAGISITGQPLISPAPHPGQAEFLRSDHPRRLLVCHRRWGKDWSSIMDLRQRIAQWKDEPHRRQLSPPISVGVIYPTYPLAREFLTALKRMTPRGEVAGVHETPPPRLVLTSGAEIEVRTGSDPEMLVAAGYDLLILGEAARLPYEAWLQCMPMLASAGRGPEGRGGLAVLQSTPKGKNWLYREMISGNWQVWHVPIFVPNTSDRHPLANPGIGQATLASDRRQMPERSFNQEWLAQFLAGEGSVFRNVRERVAPSPYPYAPPLIAGVDLAKMSDWTAFAIFDAQGHMCHMERMQRVDYQVQAERLISTLAKWHVRTCVIESNGPGDPVYEMVMRDMQERRKEFGQYPCDIVTFATTAQSKSQMINALVIAFERNEITILPDEDLINEFESYRMTTSDAGNIRFGAAEGAFDDRVMACALAWTHMRVEQQRSEQTWPTGEDAIRMRVGRNFPGAGYGEQMSPISDYYNDQNDPNRTY